MIDASGWVNSITKKPFSKAEMDELVENIYLKLKDRHLSSGESDILEIGCGSGLVLSKLIRFSKTYDATDISEVILEKCRAFLAPNLNNLETEINFYCLFAHEIDMIPAENKYDIIIINSVMHRFPDYVYAIDVLTKSRALLNDNGVLFCGDIMDADKLEDLQDFLSQEDPSLKNKKLFFKRSFFENIAVEIGFSKCRISDKIYTIPNELSLFRYDVMLYA